MSSSSKSSSYVPAERLNFLVKYGSSLAAVLRQRRKEKKLKTRTIIDPNNKAVEDIKRLKEELKTAKQSLVPPSYSLDERGGKRVIEKVEGMIKELIDVDSEHEQSYKDLLDELDEMKDNRRINLDSEKAQDSGGTGSGLSYSDQVLPFDDNSSRFEEALNKLPEEERAFLLLRRYFAKLFISDDLFIPQNVEVSKGVVIKWSIWLAHLLFFSDIFFPERSLVLKDPVTLGLLQKDPVIVEQFLNYLVAKPSFNLMRACRSSRIIISKDFVKSSSSLDMPFNSIPLSIIKVPELKRQKLQSSWIMMINNSTCKLNEQVFNIVDEAGFIVKIQHKTRRILLVHLGNFHRGMGNVVVEDSFLSEFDEFLKEEKNIIFLSLQGISRINELPESVCKLGLLGVLDLRSCQDLKSLPKDIGNLTWLSFLDLSECYQLDHIPKGITKLGNLEILLGFIIVSENQQQLKDPNHHFAEFDDLKHLSLLSKLTIRTRRMSFPTNQDLQTLNSMPKLTKLKVTWVKSFVVQSNPTADNSRSDEDIIYTEGLPETLQKLELQAAPDSTASQLLSLISKRGRYRYLKKLYIRGGTLQTKLYPNHYCFPHVKILRLRYLPLLHMNWHDFQLSFPNLSYLQVVECPNLIFFPCDQYGDWIQSESSW